MFVLKRVADLSPEEFKRTFPITLEEYNPRYKEWYEVAKHDILAAIKPEDVIRINHIGSSAVKDLIAKPMIDILLELDGCCDVTKLLEDLKTIDFGTEISTRRDDPLRLLLGKGMSVEGYADKVYLLHVRYLGNRDELYFRDYLIEHADVAAEYGKLKLKILEDIKNGVIERTPNGNPNGYSQAKLAFVQKYTDIAKQEYFNRYKPRS
jgi:GrpB-like predicted nucleotidyltransferase (UPF0157 family)